CYSKALSKLIIFDMDSGDPVTNTWIGGNGQGVQTHTQSNQIVHNGRASLRWEYFLPEEPTNNYPVIEMAVPAGKNNWTGATRVGVWMYFDTTGTKTFWTIQPVICHPYPRVTELGSWNSGASGVPPKTWLYHEWHIPKDMNLSNVTHIRFYYHAGDGWAGIAQNRKVIIYLDDVVVLSGAKTEKEKGKIPIREVRRLRLTTDKFGNGKPYFKLNNKPFLPILTYCSLDVNEMRKYKDAGFNMLYVAIDYPWVESASWKAKIRYFLKSASKLGIPIIIELQEWDFWKNWLKKHPDCNMVLANGDYVDTYPDYANPEARGEHLRRFQKIVEFLRPYFNQPIVAFSLGAYDAYHIPDGEIHIAFRTPPLTKLEQTFLPFGRYSLRAYKDYLQMQGIKPGDIGFERAEQIYLPIERDKAKNYLHWVSWIHYRRYYTYQWLKDTADLVRSLTQLPVTVTYDIKFALAERWGTPVLREAELFDFLMVYYYEFRNLELIPQRYKAITGYYMKKGVPFIDMFDAPPPNDDVEKWIQLASPFVSGYFFLPSKKIQERISKGKDLRSLFLNSVRKLQESGSWKEPPPRGEMAILLSRKDIYVTDRIYEISSLPNFFGITYDIIFDKEVKDAPDVLNEYKVIYIPREQPLMKSDKDLMTVLADFQAKKGHFVIEEGRDFEQSIARLSGLRGYQDIQSIFQTLNTLRKFIEAKQEKSPTLVENFDTLDRWENALGESAQVGNGQLIVDKKDKNMKGLMMKTPMEGSIALEFLMKAKSGKPRLTLMLDNKGKGTGELSLGQDEDGKICFFMNGLSHKLARGTKGEFYHYIVLLAKKKDVGSLVEVIVQDISGKTLAKDMFFYGGKRAREYIYLCWAWQDAEASFDSLKIYQQNRSK
ncbi:hypothetical protein J7M23_06380, partial [Candidatus Sumerlaeota bacterium]|nr:hypothetical protein [Candidatus Sumerlaeota bacterium]